MLICGNKLLTTCVLKKAKIPVPKTYIASTTGFALKAFEKVGYPAVLKPVIGDWGRIVTLVKDADVAEVVLEDREQMNPILNSAKHIQSVKI